MFNIILQLHKGGSSSSSNTISEWKPNEYQKDVIGSASDENSVLGNLLGSQGYLNTSATLRNAATDQLNSYNNSALASYDYAGDLANAQNQIAQAQQGYANLANGVLPSEYQANMEKSIMSGVQNTMGTALNGLAGRGVLNSSVTNQAMNDISKNVSNTMAEQYSNNIDTLGNLYNNQMNSSTASMNAAQQAQNNSYAPSLDMLNAGIGSYNTASSVLGLGGTTSNVQSSSGGNNAVSAVAGLTSGVLGAFCFVKGTKITMADGTLKNIEDVEVGDVVLSVSDKDRAIEKNKVIATEKAEREERVYEIVCVDDDFRTNSVKASETQPLLLANNEWVDVKDIKAGMKLYGVGDVYDVIKCGIEPVYDLRVENINTYIANGFLAYGAYGKEAQ